jgi:hypothetical protein
MGRGVAEFPGGADQPGGVLGDAALFEPEDQSA